MLLFFSILEYLLGDKCIANSKHSTTVMVSHYNKHWNSINKYVEAEQYIANLTFNENKNHSLINSRYIEKVPWNNILKKITENETVPNFFNALSQKCSPLNHIQNADKRQASVTYNIPKTQFSALPSETSTY